MIAQAIALAFGYAIGVIGAVVLVAVFASVLVPLYDRWRWRRDIKAIHRRMRERQREGR